MWRISKRNLFWAKKLYFFKKKKLIFNRPGFMLLQASGFLSGLCHWPVNIFASHNEVLLSVHYFLRICFVDKRDQEFMILSFETSPLSRTQITLLYNNSVHFKYSKGNKGVQMPTISCSPRWSVVLILAVYFSASCLKLKKHCCTQEKNNVLISNKSRSKIEINLRKKIGPRNEVGCCVGGVHLCLDMISKQVSYHTSSWPPHPLFLYCSGLKRISIRRMFGCQDLFLSFILKTGWIRKPSDDSHQSLQVCYSCLFVYCFGLFETR